MIDRVVIYKDDFVGNRNGKVLDKVIMLGVGQIKFWFIKIQIYLPITYYCVLPYKENKLVFIRAGQVIEVL